MNQSINQPVKRYILPCDLLYTEIAFEVEALAQLKERLLLLPQIFQDARLGKGAVVHTR